MRIINGVKWAPVSDGEHNEHEATINGHHVTVSSDIGGERWDCYIDGGDLLSLDATDLHGACREAAEMAH